MRLAQTQVEALQKELANAALAAEAERRARLNAESKAAVAREEATQAKRVQVKTQEGAAVLRHALEQSTRRMNQLSSENSTLIDRRVVVQLIVSYFQRNYADEVSFVYGQQQ